MDWTTVQQYNTSSECRAVGSAHVIRYNYKYLNQGAGLVSRRSECKGSRVVVCSIHVMTGQKNVTTMGKTTMSLVFDATQYNYTHRHTHHECAVT